MIEILSDFSNWVASRTLGKLFFVGLLALPVIAIWGYFGFLGRRKK